VNVTLPRPAAAPAVAESLARPRGTDARTASSRALGDRTVVAALCAVFVAIVAVTWQRWGMPEIDAGAELSTADLVKHGALVYRDVRYYYGPVGLYSLALAFKLFGASFTVAYAFGLLQTAAILATFYALARHWLAPLHAGLATTVLIAIGFSGTAFNFILPHTNSATFGLLFLLLMLLALTRERVVLAGLAAGVVGLTRPEFVAVAAGALAAYLVAQWRMQSRSQALSSTWRMALPALAIPVAVLGWFAVAVGSSRLFTENLWPVKFVHVGFKTQQNWMPFTAASAVGVLLRGGLYAGLLAGLVLSVEGVRRRRASETGAAGQLLALWPLAAVLVLIALLDGALRAVGVLEIQRHTIELESEHLVLGMSWLPALGFAAAALAALRLWRREESPLDRSWPADLALIVAASALGLRAYNAFTSDGSYAPYYAAPLVLLLGILHARLAERRPQARVALLGALGLVALGISAYAIGGHYRHDDTPVHSARGTFLTTAQAAPAFQAAIDRIDSATRPGQRIFAAPLDGGFYFMSDRRPASYELSILPGLIISRADQQAAIARLRDQHVALALIGSRDFTSWGTPTFGVDYDKLLGAYLRRAASSSTTVGTLAKPVGGTNPSNGFTIMPLVAQLPVGP
jgi:4-amino-4-deoxy-L-arabinose transferase-like glycosyltransferase